jgi:hypothetical protein
MWNVPGHEEKDARKKKHSVQPADIDFILLTHGILTTVERIQVG